MTTPEKPASDSGGSPIWQTLRVVVPIALAVLLPGVGFLARGVMSNSQDIAVLKSLILTPEAASRMIQQHATMGVHTGAASRTDLAEAIAASRRTLSDAINAIDKQQSIRDSNIRRELTEIKDALAELRKETKK